VRPAAFALVLTVGLAGCGNGGRGEGTILFQSDRSGRWDAYAARPDGSRLGRLKVGASVDGRGSILWGPRGARFFAGSLVVDARTGVQKSVGVAEAGGAAWSPDGERIAIAATRGIFVVDADGSRRRQVTHGRFTAEPAWSPDGNRIAYTSENALETVSAAGGVPSRVARVDSEAVVGQARWSPGGRWISFVQGGTARAALFVVHPDGSGRRRLAPDADEVSWAPEADVLVYVGPRGIYRTGPDGPPRRLSSTGLEPAWSPDGKRIAYVRPQLAEGVRDPTTDYQVWVMNADGSRKHAVTRPFPTGGSNEVPAWVSADVVPARVARRLPRLVSLPQRFVLRTPEPVGGLGAAGARAVVGQGLGSATEYWNPPRALLVWKPRAGTVERLHVRGCTSASDVVAAGERAAYVCDNSGVDVIDRALRVQPLTGGRPTTVVRAVATNFRPGRLLSGVAGKGRLIVAGVGFPTEPVELGFSVEQTQLSKVVGRRAVPLRHRPGRSTVVSTDGRRIAVLSEQRVEVVRADGLDFRSLAFGRNHVRDVALDGRRLFVMLRDGVDVFDVLDGGRIADWPVERGLGPQPLLEDASGGLAVYVTGIAVHVHRVADGREFVIRVPQEAGPVFARLVRDGLFYAYNRAYAKPPGRVVFVPRAALLRALRR
jgi:WD40 repeat protein